MMVVLYNDDNKTSISVCSCTVRVNNRNKATVKYCGAYSRYRRVPDIVVAKDLVESNRPRGLSDSSIRPHSPSADVGLRRFKMLEDRK